MILSLLQVVLIGIFPYLVAQANVNAVVKHKASHDQRTQVLPGFPPYNHHATHIIATDY